MVTVLLSIVCAILVYYWISTLLPVSIVRSEIMGRTSPNLIDLGIAIAAGAAGSLKLFIFESFFKYNLIFA